MPVGASLAAGLNAGRRSSSTSSSSGQRSFMPVIQTLGEMVKARRAMIGRGGRTFVAASRGSGIDQEAALREKRRQEEEAAKEEKFRYNMEQIAAKKKEDEMRELRQAEEGRRQEAHEQKMQRSAMDMGFAEEEAGRKQQNYERQEAYEQAKMGLMMGDNALVQDAFQKLMPQGSGEDVITYGENEDGTRKVTARPKEQQMPNFIFHPDGYIGVQFPGREKPVVFKDVEDVFKRVLAPMNPQRYTDKGLTGKDGGASERNKMRDIDFKNRDLRARIHDKAHTAAMEQFEADGYFQPALYNKEAYDAAYKDYVTKATGEKQEEPEKQSIEPPPGYPNAKQAPDGNWYIRKPDGSLKRVGRRKRKKGESSSPPQPRGPGRRSPMPTAEGNQIEAAGLNFKGPTISTSPERPSNKQGQVYRGKEPPAQYPDAQWDEEKKAWMYFDENEGWQTVRM